MSTLPEFSTENLLKLLDQLIIAINDGTITDPAQESLWYSLTWDKNDPDNQETIKYLLTGWWLQILSNASPNAT